MFEFLFSRSDSHRVKKLENRVSELETALRETTELLKKIASLSLQTARELEFLTEHVRKIEQRNRPPDLAAKKSNDFYN